MKIYGYRKDGKSIYENIEYHDLNKPKLNNYEFNKIIVLPIL